VDVDRRTEQLFCAVYDAPDDDAPRRRLAEHLSSRKDPRGEFLALQLAPAPSRTELQQARDLLAKHEGTWLEPLGGALAKKSVRWERGFPVAGHLALRRAEGEQEALPGRRALATLRELDLEPPNTVFRTNSLDRLLFDSPLRGLRVLRGMPRSLLARMLTAKPAFAIEELHVAQEGGGGLEGEKAELAEVAALQKAFAEGRGLPRLRDLSLSWAHAHGREPETYAWLWKSALGRRMERLRINTGEYVLPAWLNVLEKHESRLALKQLVLFGRHDLTLSRTEDGFTLLTGKLGEHCSPPEREHFEKNLRPLEKRLTVQVTRRKTAKAGVVLRKG
jgi:hypothetical protein